MSFIENLWTEVEPSQPFVKGWAIEAITEHLEAVQNGEIRNLYINIFPGALKSLATSVFFPAWVWGPKKKPSTRFLSLSYSSTLSQRDNGRFRQLITSSSYRKLWGARFQPAKDKFSVIEVHNNKAGWKIATSVGGTVTGLRADIVLCLSGSTLVLTEFGWKRIDSVVNNKIPDRIIGYDDGGNLVPQNIDAYEKNPGRQLVELCFDGGSIKCTEDHPIFIVGRGYVGASEVREGDRVEWCGHGFPLPELLDGNAPQTKSAQEVLLHSLPDGFENSDGVSGKQSPMRSVWNGFLSMPSALAAQSSWKGVLQQGMFRKEKYRRKQSSLHRFLERYLRTLRGGVPKTPCQWEILFLRMLGESKQHTNFGKVGRGQIVPGVLRHIQTNIRNSGVLYESLREFSALEKNARVWERSLRSRKSQQSLSIRLDGNLSRLNPRERFIHLCSMRDERRCSWEKTMCPSHRLCEGKPFSDEPHNSLQILSRQTPRKIARQGSLDQRIVRSVRAAPSEEFVYNVRTGTHNYFANGILVHNCDDPNSISESESKLVLESTGTFFKETLPTRLNNPDRSSIVVIQQRTSSLDITGIIQAEELDYEALIIPMEFDPRRFYTSKIGWSDPRGMIDMDPYGEVLPEPEFSEQEGALAFPERFPRKVVEDLKKILGPYGTSGQLNQSPEPRGGGIFKEEWWKIWPPEDIIAPPEGKQMPYPAMDYVIASLDTGYTEKEENDPSALTIWGVWKPTAGWNKGIPQLVTENGQLMRGKEDTRSKIMLMYGWEKHLILRGPPSSPPPGVSDAEWNSPAWRTERRKTWGLVEWVIQTCRDQRVDHLIIEAKANGMPAAQEMERSFQFEQFTIELVDPSRQGDKVARAHSVVNLFSNGRVYAPQIYNHETERWDYPTWCRMVLDRMRVFPKGSHDDIVDSATAALRYLRSIGLASLSDEQEVDETEENAYKPQSKPLYDV